jgi:TolB-like protein/class 3 adenylate cyclase/Tfp pilus assembly protein PilF
MNQSLKRQHSVVFFSDIVGYTLLMGEDEDRAFELMKKNVVYHQQVFEKFNGRLIKELGDGILGVFESADEALKASLEIQKIWAVDPEVTLRIGLHAGEIIFENNDIFGDAVNVASRIQSIGVPSCVLFSNEVLLQITNQSLFPKINLGFFILKNVTRKLELYALTIEPLAIPKRQQMIKTVKFQERQSWKYWLGIAALFGVIGFLIWTIIWNPSNPWETDKSVAVLPLKNLNADSSKEYFSDGLTEDIITQLSKINSLKVISRSSAVLYKNSQESNSEIAFALGVSTLLEGSVQWSGEKIRIRVQLIDVNSNQAIWAETYDLEKVEDLFEVQSNIAESIAAKLEANVTLDEINQLKKRPTASFDAYQEYLIGRKHYYEYELDQNLLAIESFKKAIALDENFALAWAGLADSYAQMEGVFYQGTVWIDSALNAGKEGINKDSRLAEPYKALGVTYYYNNQYALATDYLEKAVEISNNHAQAIGNLATVYFESGQLDKSLDLQRKAVGLNPKSFVPLQILGWNYRLLENQKEAQFWFRKSLSLKSSSDTYEQLGLSFLAEGKLDSVSALIPRIVALDKNDPYSLQSAGILAFMKKDFKLAKNLFEEAMKLKSNWDSDPYFSSPVFLAYLLKKDIGYIIGAEGKTIDAQELIDRKLANYEEVVKSSKPYKDFALFAAALEALKGNNSQAMQYLEQAKELQFQDYIMIDSNVLFDNLRSSSDFIFYLEKIKGEIRVMGLNSWANNQH